MPTVAKPLFRPGVLRPHLAAFQLPERVQALQPTLAQWAEMFATGRADSFKERELLPQFINDFFVGLLGYDGPAASPERYTLSLEKHVEVDGQYADAVIGDFRQASQRFIVAVEGSGRIRFKAPLMIRRSSFSAGSSAASRVRCRVAAGLGLIAQTGTSPPEAAKRSHRRKAKRQPAS